MPYFSAGNNYSRCEESRSSRALRIEMTMLCVSAGLASWIVRLLVPSVTGDVIKIALWFCGSDPG